jgi:GNAT superfamily N-acetyltransferase
VRFLPLTPARWKDLAALFGGNGACGGCWCMWWRLPAARFAAGKGAKNRRAFRRLVAEGPPPGILAYDGAEPVGWCAIAPREEYVRFDRSRVLAPVDGEPVWSVTCFFVRRDRRRTGLTRALLEEAVRFAARRGAHIVEGYPVDPRGGSSADAFVYTGLLSAFRAAGFREVARRSPTRPIVRRTTD